MPKRPFEEVAADMFYHAGRHYLIYADRLSGFPIVAEWQDDPTAQQVAYQCRQFFANLGVPVRFRSDNGPQFASKTFKDFLTRWGVRPNTSTPYYPQANYAEVYVKKVKLMLSKLSTPSTTSEEFCEAMLELRNTPNADGRSPNEIVFGRNLRSRVPAHHSSFDKHWQEDADVADAKKAMLKEKAAAYYDSAAHDLRPMKAGTRVRVQDPVTKLWDKIADIVAVGSRRNYRLKMPSGRLTWRNRRFLRRFNGAIEDNENDIGDDRNDQEENSPDAEEIANDPPIRRSPRERKQTVRFTI